MDQFEAALQGAEAIVAYDAAGEKFTNEQNKWGVTSGMYAAQQGAAAIAAYAAAGGKFTYQQDVRYMTAGMYAAQHGVEAFAAYEKAVEAQAKVVPQPTGGAALRELTGRPASPDTIGNQLAT